jgi:hypothetical protein
MEDAAWSPDDSSFRSPNRAGDPARPQASLPGIKINTLSGEYSFPMDFECRSRSPDLMVWLRGGSYWPRRAS